MGFLDGLKLLGGNLFSEFSPEIKKNFLLSVQEDIVDSGVFSFYPTDLRSYLKLKLSKSQQNFNGKNNSTLTNGQYLIYALREYFLFVYLKERGYLNPLLMKYKQLTYVDDYGDFNDDSFRAEIKRFASSRFSIYHYDVLEFIPVRVLKYLESVEEVHLVCYEQDSFGKGEFCDDLFSILQDKGVEDEDNSKDAVLPDLKGINHQDFEHLVCSVFNGAGWKAKVTKGSGDQGADVIAEKNNDLLVIQCKFYSQPVGNKAVQEASAAKGYYGASHAMVVTNSTFTKSAKQLASTLNVELKNIYELIPDDNRINSVDLAAATFEKDFKPREILESLGFSVSELPGNKEDMHYCVIAKSEESSSSLMCVCIESNDLELDEEYISGIMQASESIPDFYTVLITASPLTEEAIELTYEGDIIVCFPATVESTLRAVFLS